MQESEVARAITIATTIAASQGLQVEDATVLQNSNKLTVRLLPCDILARIAPEDQHVAQFEVELTQKLRQIGSPVAALDPRVEPAVYEQDGFAITFWTYYPPSSTAEVSPVDYAAALQRLHAGLRQVDIAAPHFTDRVAEAQALVADHDRTPGVVDADRELLDGILRGLRRVIGGRGGEQLLHGEPHPGNLLNTRDGLIFVDLETCCRGPIEFDLAHAPDDVAEHYPGVDDQLLQECRILKLAMITAWRWDKDDQLPDGRRLGAEWLAQIRASLDHPAATVARH